MPRTRALYTDKNGETHTIAEWARKTGMNVGTLIDRLKKKHMTIDEALSTPTTRAYSSIKDPITIPKVYKNPYGEAHTLSEWEDVSDIAKETINRRMTSYNWSLDCAANIPTNNFEAILFAKELYKQHGQLMDAISFRDILGNHYTQAEWEAHQAVFFD